MVTNIVAVLCALAILLSSSFPGFWWVVAAFVWVAIVRTVWVERQRQRAISRLRSSEALSDWIERNCADGEYAQWVRHFDRQVLDLTKWRVKDFM